MAFVVVFGSQTFAEGTADDEVLVYANKMVLPIVSSIQVTDTSGINTEPGLLQTAG